jgi:hypothetical protein
VTTDVLVVDPFKGGSIDRGDTEDLRERVRSRQFDVEPVLTRISLTSSGKLFLCLSVPINVFHPSATMGAFSSVPSSEVRPRAPLRSRIRSATASSPLAGNR